MPRGRKSGKPAAAVPRATRGRPAQSDDGTQQTEPMDNDDQPQTAGDQSINQVMIDEDKLVERVSAKVMEGMKALLEPASSHETSRNQPPKAKRSVASTSGQGSTKRLRLVPEMYDSSDSGSVIGAADICRDNSSSGEESDPQLSSYNFVSLKRPLGASLSENTKLRIVSNKYVPFRELINTSTNQQEYGIKVRNNVSGALTLTRATPDEAKVSRDQWVTAFYTFTAIMTEKFPKLSPGLMKYGSIITGMADRGMDWRYYDSEFRKSNHKALSVPWGELDNELYLMCQSVTNVPNNKSIKRQDKSGVKKRIQGQCWASERNSGVCTRINCSFRHQCTKCGSNHPSNRCRQTIGSKGSNPNKTKPA